MWCRYLGNVTCEDSTWVRSHRDVIILKGGWEEGRGIQELVVCASQKDSDLMATDR